MIKSKRLFFAISRLYKFTVDKSNRHIHFIKFKRLIGYLMYNIKLNLNLKESRVGF